MPAAKTANKRSGNPAKRAAAKASSVKDFKKRKQGQILELPSGLRMAVRRVEMTVFLRSGDVPNSLLPIVQEALEKGKDVDMEALVGKPEDVDLGKIEEIYDLMGAVACQTSVEPKINPVPDDEDDRDGDLLYVDELEDEDRMFLFQYAIGGTADLATFRRELESDVATVAKKSESARAAKRPSRAKKR